MIGYIPPRAQEDEELVPAGYVDREASDLIGRRQYRVVFGERFGVVVERSRLQVALRSTRLRPSRRRHRVRRPVHLAASHGRSSRSL